MFRLGKPATAKPICLNRFAALPTEQPELGSRAAKLMSYADPSRRRSGTDEQVEQVLQVNESSAATIKILVKSVREDMVTAAPTTC